ncbi:hypothetical protein ABZX40_30155 [Streptomyces sp. NPDC004610]|uniref:lactate/malate family dehydrogenase n=1 Tax=unclassified Streptomyces TaxID=2593676 RepID=UPI0033BE3F0F
MSAYSECAEMSAGSGAPPRRADREAAPHPRTRAGLPGGRTRVSIVGGAGGVGSALTRDLIASRSGYEISLLGRRSESVTCQLMDLEALEPFGHASLVRRGDIGGLPDSDVIVIAASVPFSPQKKRIGFLHDNAEILRPYFRAIARLPEHWPGRVVVVSNPVDVLATWLQNSARIDPRRIVGYSWNDSLRLRVAVARVLGIDPRHVEAWIIGEHGDLCVPLLDHVRVAGRQVRLGPDERAAVLTLVREWYPRWVALGLARTTVWSTAAGVSRMIREAEQGGPADCAVSVSLQGEYGLRGVSLGLPVSLEAAGLPRVREFPLTRHEHDVLRGAATAVQRQARALGPL